MTIKSCDLHVKPALHLCATGLPTRSPLDPPSAALHPGSLLAAGHPGKPGKSSVRGTQTRIAAAPPPCFPYFIFLFDQISFQLLAFVFFSFSTLYYHLDFFKA